MPIRDLFRREPREDGAGWPSRRRRGSVTAHDEIEEAPPAPPVPRSRFSPRAWIGQRNVPANLWVRCGNDRCKELIYTGSSRTSASARSASSTPACRPPSASRCCWTRAPSSKKRGLQPGDPLEFVSAGQRYQDKLIETQAKTGLGEAITCGTGAIEGAALRLAVADFSFMGASMGSVVGEGGAGH